MPRDRAKPGAEAPFRPARTLSYRWQGDPERMPEQLPCPECGQPMAQGPCEHAVPFLGTSSLLHVTTAYCCRACGLALLPAEEEQVFGGISRSLRALGLEDAP